MRLTSFILFTLLGQILLGQNAIGTNHSQSKVFDDFQLGKYELVVQRLSNKKTLSTQETYLMEMSQVKLGSTSTTRLQILIKDSPKYALNSLASFVVGHHYFHEEELQNALRFLKGVDGSQLSETDRSDFYFMRGYLSLNSSAYKSAANYFARSQRLSENSKSKLTYYQGFSFYHLNEKEKALGYLDKVRDDEQFGVSANFFTAKIKLEEGKYAEVIALAQTKLSDERSETNSAFYQLVGEAYALQNQADKSSSYFTRAIELHPGTPSAALYYQAGVTNFKLGLKTKAIKYLTEAGIRSGDYAHLSAFQLARLYVSLNEKEKALAAYIEASASSVPDIKEEATFKAGKLQIDQQNHAEGINYLKDYLSQYKDGKWNDEADHLLAEAYLRTSNYDQAIDHLLEVGISNTSQKAIYQKVTFQKAQLRFNDAEFDQANKWFQESLKYPIDIDLGNKAWFLVGELYYHQSRFENAIRAYKSQNRPSVETYYGLAYSNYNLQKYPEAASYFNQVLRLSPAKKLREDTEVRLADCYYATKSYEKALEIYRRYSRQTRSPYLFYQTGLVSKNLGNKDEAISAFEQVVRLNDEALKDDAIFQMAQLSFEGAEFEQSEFHFSKLIGDYPNSPYLAESYLNRAVSRTNLGKLEGAKADYEFVLNNYLSSKIAFNAILGLQELESKGVRVSNIQAEIEKYKKANPNDESLEVIEFDFAKSQYFNLAYFEAIGSFAKFINEYPKSSSLNDAKYYLADSYYRNDSLREARKYFGDLRSVRNELTGRVLSRLGEINYRLENYDEAKSAWEELLTLGITPKDTYNGRSGLMKAFYAGEEFEKTIQIAEQIINAEWQPLNASRNALLVKGNALRELGNSELALVSYSRIANGADQISAEAAYNVALLASDAAEYQTSLDSLFSFNTRFGSYADWIDKSYLLIAGNYIEMGELFQAKATLRSIIQHSQNQAARASALEKLNAIENQSIEDTTTTSNN